MFRSASSLQKLAMGVIGVAGMQFGAAVVVEKKEQKPVATPKFDLAESDRRLKKKPEWFQFAVTELEKYIRKFSAYGFIEHETLTNEAIEWFEKCNDQNNFEIQWRLARAYVEKAKLDIIENRNHYFEQRTKLLDQALEMMKKALAHEPHHGSAGAHKWYAIILQTYVELLPLSAGRNGSTKAKKLAPHDGNVRNEIIAHLQKAVELDPIDPFAWNLLGVEYFNKKEYKKAMDCFQKAEAAKPDFSAANRYWIGKVYHANKENEKAKESLFKAMSMQSKNKLDGRAKANCKQVLVFGLGIEPEQVNKFGTNEWKYQPSIIYDETVKF